MRANLATLSRFLNLQVNEVCITRDCYGLTAITLYYTGPWPSAWPDGLHLQRLNSAYGTFDMYKSPAADAVLNLLGVDGHANCIK